MRFEVVAACHLLQSGTANIGYRIKLATALDGKWVERSTGMSGWRIAWRRLLRASHLRGVRRASRVPVSRRHIGDV